MTDSDEGTELPLQTPWSHSWLPGCGFWIPQGQPAHCPGVPKGPVPTPGVTGTHPLLSYLCSQVQTRKEQRAKLGKGIRAAESGNKGNEEEDFVFLYLHSCTAQQGKGNAAQS